MESATVPDPQETVAARSLASLAALGVCGALFAAQQLEALPWNGRFDSTSSTLTILGAVALVTASCPWVPRDRRRGWVLGGSILVGVAIVRALIVVPLAFAWLTSRVARTTWPVALKLLVLLAVWLLVIAARRVAPFSPLLPYGQLAMYWACIPTAAVCLVLERDRGQLEHMGMQDECSYLLALPRFFFPFLQPIGASTWFNSRAPFRPRLALRALGLGVLALGCLLLVTRTHYAAKGSYEHFDLLVTARRLLQTASKIYGVNASGIFCAVALFRLQGHDLGSGFRQPLLASSFSDLYRRWNYYFFEFVSANLYLPLVGRLRRVLPLPIAYALAGYLGVLVGVWATDNGTFQLATGGWDPFLREMTDWQDLMAHFAIWSLIILPQLFVSRLRKLRRLWLWRAFAHVATLGVGVLVLVLLYWYGVSVY